MPLTTAETEEWTIDAIIDEREINPKVGKEYLVAWRHYPREEATWEPAKSLEECEAVELWEEENAYADTEQG